MLSKARAELVVPGSECHKTCPSCFESVATHFGRATSKSMKCAPLAKMTLDRTATPESRPLLPELNVVFPRGRKPVTDVNSVEIHSQWSSFVFFKTTIWKGKK